MNDAGSLRNLNDIVVPAPVPWWPPAPGWLVVAFIVLMLVIVIAVRQWRLWRRNRYRRQALQVVSSIRQGNTAPGALPLVLKRAALSAWPREEVASLSGPAWHRFLDESCASEQFLGGAGDTLDQLSYAELAKTAPFEGDYGQALDAAEHWLKHHRSPPRAA